MKYDPPRYEDATVNRKDAKAAKSVFAVSGENFTATYTLKYSTALPSRTRRAVTGVPAVGTVLLATD